MFDRTFLSDITWTGKTNQKGVKKIALKKYVRILDLASNLTKASCSSYSTEKCEQYIKYEILKYAHKGANKENENLVVVETAEIMTTTTQNVIQCATAVPVQETAKSIHNQPSNTQTSQQDMPQAIYNHPPITQSSQHSNGVPPPYLGQPHSNMPSGYVGHQYQAPFTGLYQPPHYQYPNSQPYLNQNPHSALAPQSEPVFTNL